MISEFSLDHDFFSARTLNDDANSAAHDFITRSWLDAGVLILPRGGISDVLKLIDTFPPKFRQRWLEAIEYGKKYEFDREGHLSRRESLASSRDYKLWHENF